MRQLLLVRGIYENHADDGSGVAQSELPDEDSSKRMADKNERRRFVTLGQESS